MPNEYRCAYCGYIFTEPEVLTMRHGLDTPPYETWYVCPDCKSPVSTESYEICSGCGVKMLSNTEMAVVGRNKYCPDCYEIKTI